jgi:hypothetical protein
MFQSIITLDPTPMPQATGHRHRPDSISPSNQMHLMLDASVNVYLEALRRSIIVQCELVVPFVVFVRGWREKRRLRVSNLSGCHNLSHLVQSSFTGIGGFARTTEPLLRNSDPVQIIVSGRPSCCVSWTNCNTGSRTLYV